MASLANALNDDDDDDDEVLGGEKKSFSTRGRRRMVLSTIQQEQLQQRGGNFKFFADAAQSKSSGETTKKKNNKDLKYACFYCFKKFHSLDLLKKHAAKEMHDEKHDVVCTNCRKVCKTYFRLREHLVGATASEACKEAFEEKGGCRKCLRIPEDAGGVHVCAFGSSTGSSSSVRKKEGVCDECAPHVAIDCEMIATTKSDETLAKVCVVNGLDESVLMETVVTFCSKNGEEEGKEDEKVKVLDYRTEITGLTASDFETKLLPTLAEAREEVLACLAGAHKNTPEMWKNKPHKLVVHDARHDLRALQITDEDVPNLFDRIRDTSTYVPLQKEKGKRVKLKKLVEQFLEADDADADNTLRNFQSPNAPHSPHLDALAALRLYRGCRDNCFHFQAVQKGPLLRRKASSTTPSTTTPGGGEEEKIEYFKTPVLLENEEEKNEKDTWLCCCWCEDFASANT
ncbi:unnamed protein product [Bathycoccus prasinos]|jgi:hypothetical protein